MVMLVFCAASGVSLAKQIDGLNSKTKKELTVSDLVSSQKPITVYTTDTFNATQFEFFPSGDGYMTDSNGGAEFTWELEQEMLTVTPINYPKWMGWPVINYNGQEQQVLAQMSLVSKKIFFENSGQVRKLKSVDTTKIEVKANDIDGGREDYVDYRHSTDTNKLLKDSDFVAVDTFKPGEQWVLPIENNNFGTFELGFSKGKVSLDAGKTFDLNPSIVSGQKFEWEKSDDNKNMVVLFNNGVVLKYQFLNIHPKYPMTMLTVSTPSHKFMTMDMYIQNQFQKISENRIRGIYKQKTHQWSDDQAWSIRFGGDSYAKLLNEKNELIRGLDWSLINNTIFTKSFRYEDFSKGFVKAKGEIAYCKSRANYCKPYLVREYKVVNKQGHSMFVLRRLNRADYIKDAPSQLMVLEKVAN